MIRNNCASRHNSTSTVHGRIKPVEGEGSEGKRNTKAIDLLVVGSGASGLVVGGLQYGDLRVSMVGKRYLGR